MIKCDKLYSPQAYLYAVTEDCYCVDGDNDIETIADILSDYDLSSANYPLHDITAIADKIDVVLVDCMVYNEQKKQFEHQYRWFEVPDDFCDDEEQ